jgi:phosphoribosylformimino-5-aminoimidazole carboxamide ribotide isomerase
VTTARTAEVNLYAAIDILEGKAVRLERGDFERRTVYGEDPLEAARHWVAQGARFLHVVDLDGAKRGETVSVGHLRRIAAEFGDSTEVIQYGGGLRSVEAAQAALEAGADRIVIGTAAFTTPGLLEDLVAADPARVAVAVDVRSGYVTVRGWLEGTAQQADVAIAGLVGRGVQTVIYTDVERDGTLGGVSPRMVERLCETATGARLLYSGGVGKLDDVRALAELRIPNFEGVIVGKALYERRFSVSEGLAALAGGTSPGAGPP